MKIVENAVKGLTTALNKESNLNMALIQSSWRFYNNDRVDENELFELTFPTPKKEKKE